MLSIAFGNVTTAGNITASVTGGVHPNSGTSSLSASKYVNRYWTATNSGTAFNNYSATFTFVSGDIQGGASTSALKLGKYDASTWTYPTVSANTSTTATATGMTAFSDFILAECINTVISSQPATTQTICQSATPTDLSLTATGTSLTYQWYSNTSNANSGGTLITGAISSTYTPSTSNGGTTYYYCVVTGICGTVTSNASEVIVTPTATPSVVIAVTGGSNPSCVGPTGITFTATPTNGGAAPLYQWKKNGANAIGLGSPNPAIFTPLTPLQSGDLITVAMVSNATCASPTTVISNTITIMINPLPAITLGTVTAICEGTNSFAVPYSATANGANQFSITTGSNALSGFSAISNQAFTSTPLSISIPNGSAAGTYDFNLSVKNSTTGCESGIYPISLTINATSSTPTASVIQPTCATSTATITGNAHNCRDNADMFLVLPAQQLLQSSPRHQI